MSIPRGIATAVALYAFTAAITFLVVSGYGTMLRVFGAARLERTLVYAQTAFGLLSYAGIVVVMQIVREYSLTTFTLPRDMWLYFFPPAWFASYLEIAEGAAEPSVWIRAVLSLLFLAAMASLLRGRLSADYAERIGQLAAVSNRAASAPRQPRRRALGLFKRDEARAVSLLVRAQFRHDMKVRLGILSIVPMTLLYMYIGGGEGTGDPFVERQIPGVDLTAMVVLLFPSVISQQLSWSDAYKASWIYFATPADRADLIVATKNVIVAFFILPFVVFLAAVYAWKFGHAGHALAHAVFLGLIAHLVLQAAVLILPRLPFATTQKKATSNALFFAMMLLTFATANAILFVLQRWVYVEWTRVVAALTLLIAAAFAMNLPLRARAAALLRHQAPELG